MPDTAPATPFFEVNDLRITFRGRDRVTEAVQGASFSFAEGETVAIVGESGSGKSVTAMSLTQLLPTNVTEVSGEVNYHGKNLLALPAKEIRKYRGKEISYIFQEPGTSLNPVFTVGSQIAEVIKIHLPEEKDPKGRAIRYMELVGIKDSAKRYGSYPHELSGGMNQRIMIAMALACEPRILVADEPTTALDVTIQKQIIDLLADLKKRLGMSVILITHNFGIVKGFADQVVVMFRGKIVEQGRTDDILANPQHPYTKALIGCIPRLGQKLDRLPTIDHEQLALAEGGSKL